MSHEAHNAALMPVLKLVTTAAPQESDQWILLESLCLAVGLLHKRTPRQTAEFIELMAERISTGERDCLGLGK